MMPLSRNESSEHEGTEMEDFGEKDDVRLTKPARTKKRHESVLASGWCVYFKRVAREFFLGSYMNVLLVSKQRIVFGRALRLCTKPLARGVSLRRKR
jgi:hypothetical protein